jgi:alpha-D-xyloside xylohydrolase
VATFPDGVNWPLQPSGPVLTFDAGPLQARISQNTGHIQLTGPDLAGNTSANLVQLTPPAVLTSNGPLVFGKVVSSQPVANGLALRQTVGAAQVHTQFTFAHEGVLRYEVVDWGSIVPLQTAIAGPSAAQEHFFGFGEKFNALDQSGKRIDMLTFDDPRTKHDHSYKVAPWFISTRGYGVHLDSSAESTFDMGAGAPDRFVLTNRFSSLRLNIVYGPAMTDVLSRYTGYTGRPPLPPPWAFGPWISSDIWRNGGEVRYAVTQFRDRGIPASAFVFDSPWETAYNDFQFNLTQFGADTTIDGVHYPGFGSVAEMMQFLRANGLKVICWMTPLVNVNSGDEHVAGHNLGQAANYADGAGKGVFVRQAPGGAPLVVPWWKGRGSPIDFTSSVGRSWLQDQLQRLVDGSRVATASGATEPVIGGFKTDDGESGNGPNTYIPATAAYADGRTGVEMRNGFCLEYHRAVWNVLGTSGVLFARSGFAGSQAFPGYWGGDNEPNFGDNGLPSVIVAGQSAAMSGYSIWGHDVGGYQDTNFSHSPPNLFMRWAQFGCFSPIMQMHRQVTRELQYPWRFGDQASANYQFFARLHVRLFPYIYTYAKEASTTGLPIIRPLVLLDQADHNTYGVEHAYRFGNELLVAPMLAPDATSRDVYLPAGNWLDFWSNTRHAGGQIVTWTNTNQAQLPLFVREGAIIPMLLDDVRTLCDANYVNDPHVSTTDGSWLIQVYPGGDSTFTVFDGTRAQCQGTAATGTITVSSTPRRMALRILANEPGTVLHDGAVMPRQQGAQPGASGWQYDASAGFIEVGFAHAGGTSRIDYR